MKRRSLIKLLAVFSIPLLSGCGLSRIDPWHYLIRSDQIRSPEQEAAILAKAKLGWTNDGQVRVLYLKGTPYERGYQHGVLLRDEIRDNLSYIHKLAVKKFYFTELFDEAYERMRPFIPQEYIEEMHGLAHGARLPISLVHHLHVLPSIGEWSGRKNVRKIIKQMISGELGTSCSNFSMGKGVTADKNFYVVRILDWGLHRISKLHQYPLITISVPSDGYPSANIGWVGFIGAVSGMNSQGITLGEMGYGDPENETLRGKPMVFLLRDVMKKSSNLANVRKLLKDAVGTSSFAFLMSDGKNKDAQLYIKDRDRFRVFNAGQEAIDKEEFLPAIPSVSYGGHYEERMSKTLKAHHGEITLNLLKEKIIPEFAMKSNFQNVIYAPSKLQFWVNNAKSKSEWSANQPYTFFDFGKALEEFE